MLTACATVNQDNESASSAFSDSSTQEVSNSSAITYQEYFNMRYGYTLKFPEKYGVSVDEMNPDETVASAISLLPPGVTVEAYGKNTPPPARNDFPDEEKWQVVRSFYASLSKPISEVAAAYAKYQNMITGHHDAKISAIEKSTLNGFPSYTYTRSYSVDWKQQGGIQQFEETCHALENDSKDKILLCFSTKAPSNARNIYDARVIAESFAFAEN